MKHIRYAMKFRAFFSFNYKNVACKTSLAGIRKGVVGIFTPTKGWNVSDDLKVEQSLALMSPMG